MSDSAPCPHPVFDFPKVYAVDQIVITYNNGLSQVASTNVDINIWEFYMVDSNVNISITYKAA